MSGWGIMSGKDAKKQERDLDRRLDTTLGALRELVSARNRSCDLETFMLRVSADGKTVERQRGGVQYVENGRPMRVLARKGPLLAFKVPAKAEYGVRGGYYYYPANVIVCLVSDGTYQHDAQGDWLLAWTIAEWGHKRGTYGDPKKERE